MAHEKSSERVLPKSENRSQHPVVGQVRHLPQEQVAFLREYFLELVHCYQDALHARTRASELSGTGQAEPRQALFPAFQFNQRHRYSCAT